MLIWEKWQYGPCCDVFGVGGAVQGASSLASAGIQAGAAIHASNQMADSAQRALDFQKQQYGDTRANQAPYVAAGQNALGKLQDYSSYVNPYDTDYYSNSSFAPPGNTQTGQFSYTGQDLQNDPGYKFRYDQGLQALQRSEAATGNLGGGAAKAAIDYGQGAASQEYQNAYGRALNTAQQNQSANQQNFGQQATAYQLNTSNELNRYNANQNNYRQNTANNAQIYDTNLNRLQGLASLGQGSTAQLANAGLAAAGNVGNLATQQGNAYAAGTVGLGNALSGLSTNLGQIYANNSPTSQPLNQLVSPYYYPGY